MGTGRRRYFPRGSRPENNDKPWQYFYNIREAEDEVLLAGGELMMYINSFA